MNLLCNIECLCLHARTHNRLSWCACFADCEAELQNFFSTKIMTSVFVCEEIGSMHFFWQDWNIVENQKFDISWTNCDLANACVDDLFAADWVGLASALVSLSFTFACQLWSGACCWGAPVACSCAATVFLPLSISLGSGISVAVSKNVAILTFETKWHGHFFQFEIEQVSECWPLVWRDGV